MRGKEERVQMKSKKRYTVSDGKLMLQLQPAEEGGYIVTSPLDPELITEAESLEEAFVNASDVIKALRQSRAKLFRKSSG
jgi:antitoxin HicB